MSARYLVATALAIATGAPAVARAGTVGEGIHRQLAAARTPSPPAIDGDLSEPAWAAAAPSDDFTQTYPIDGAAPTVRTEVRVLFDDRALYVGVLCHDPQPGGIAARLARRDDTVESDHVALVIDPRHDHDTGYWFWLNAAGVKADAQLHDDMRMNGSWDAVWRGAARVHAGGWTAELAIPWSVLRFPTRPPAEWGFNLSRFVARSKETVQWVRVPPSASANLSRAGHLTGLAALAPPRALELRPFALARAHVDLPGGGGLGLGGDADGRFALSAGLDAKHAVGGDLTLDLTVLPDFGQVEADPAVLNLTTFETFFPEKRPFFLENADLFGTDIRLFHSRRIGQRTSSHAEGDAVETGAGEPATVTEAPLAVPIWAAARLTGRLTRRFTIAALDALTGPERIDLVGADGQASTIEPTPVRNYSVLRGKYSLGVSNYLGFLATALARAGEVEDPARDHDAMAGSIDGRWVAADGTYRAFFHVAGTARVGGPTWVEQREQTAPCTADTCTPITRADGGLQRPGDTGLGAIAGVAKPGGEHWVGMVMFNTRSPRFDANDVGFEPEWDLHRGYGEINYRERQPFGWFQAASARVDARAAVGWDGLRQDAGVGGAAGVVTRGFHSVNLSLGWRPAGTFTRRETSDGAAFERSDWAWVDTSVATDSRRRLRGNWAAGAGYSQRWGTWNLWTSGGVSARPSSALEISAAVAADLTEDQLRFHHCDAADGRSCTRLSAMRDYTLGHLDHGSLSLTGRIGWALSTRLSLQGWAQLFAARGRWFRYRQIAGEVGAEPTLEGAELQPTSYAGDDDGDGVKDDDFASAALSTNLVLSWELQPGAFLTAVYTRAQATDRALAGERPRIGFAGLGRAATEEVFLLKLGWYWAR